MSPNFNLQLFFQYISSNEILGIDFLINWFVILVMLLGLVNLIKYFIFLTQQTLITLSHLFTQQLAMK
jgi:hypothetical protein